MTRIAIVGGGITGLATKALVNNANVVLYEASNRLGGILKDYKIDKSSFFTSCQYFSGESSWFERMDLFSDFYEFSHTYGSYTDIFGSETLSGTSINCHLAAFKRLEPLRSRCHSQKNLYFSRCPIK